MTTSLLVFLWGGLGKKKESCALCGFINWFDLA